MIKSAWCAFIKLDGSGCYTGILGTFQVDCFGMTHDGGRTITIEGSLFLVKDPVSQG